MAKKRLSVTQKLVREVINLNKDIKHDLTRKQYNRDSIRFIKWCRQSYDVHSLEECREHVQDYANYLWMWSYTPSTIHTYAASICHTFKIPMSELDLPKRETARYIRGRSEPKKYSVNNDLENEKWEYLVDFAKKVGVRRSEYAKLRKEDFEIESDGEAYILIRSGKCGKFQKQHILSRDANSVKTYFDNAQPGEYIFPRSLFKNSLNLHAIRAQRAKEYYNEMVNNIKTIPGYREQLEQRLRDHWNKYNINPRTGKPRRFPEERLHGYYILRGEGRQKALAAGKDIRFLRIAVFATSVFSLSHFRLSVSIESYLSI